MNIVNKGKRKSNIQEKINENPSENMLNFTELYTEEKQRRERMQ